MCLYPRQVLVKPKDRPSFWSVVSCGKCFQCLEAQSREWSFRICDEASKYEKNCFITLTYDDVHLPSDGSVDRMEVTLFMKRLRKALHPQRIRFFACGEYGSKYKRPHYHVIIFGWFPDDAYFWTTDKKHSVLYRSPLLERVWTKGFSSVGQVTYDTAKYCAKYLGKYAFTVAELGQNGVAPVAPPFVQMSNRPGIGFDSVYKSDLLTDRIYRDGKEQKIPRYYLKVMERDGVYLDDLRQLRLDRGVFFSRDRDLIAEREKYEEIYKKILRLKS